MIRKYEHDFSEQGKKEVEAYQKVKKSYKILIVFSSLLVAFSIPFFFLKGMPEHSLLGEILYYFTFPICFGLLGLTIATFIITMVKVKKNKLGKREVPFKIAHILLAIVVLANAAFTVVSFGACAILSMGNYNTGNMITYEGAVDPAYDMLSNKSESRIHKDLVSKNDTFQSFVSRGVSTILLNKSPSYYTTEEAALMNEYNAFEATLPSFADNYWNKNMCFITKDKQAFNEFVGSALSDKGFLVISIDEALQSSDFYQMNLVCGYCTRYNSGSYTGDLYSEPVYINTCFYNTSYESSINKISLTSDGSEKYVLDKSCSALLNFSQTKDSFSAIHDESKVNRYNGYKIFFDTFIKREESFKDARTNNLEKVKVYCGTETYKKFTTIPKFVSLFEGSGLRLAVINSLSLCYVIFLICRKKHQINRLDFYYGATCASYQAKYVDKECDVKPLLESGDYAKAIKEANAVQNVYIEKRKKEIEEAKAFVKEMKLEDKSHFDGRAIQLLGWNILGKIVTFVTLGILYPVKVAWVEGWKINHRYINGKKLHFDGNGFQLLGKYILWWLLSIVTLGIYAIVLPKKIQQWVTSHTYFVDLDHTDVRTKKLYMDHGVTKESQFEGKIIKLFFMKLWANFLTLITLGILLPAKICAVYRWKVNGQNINGLRMKFNGNTVQLLGKYIVWWLLSIVTLGIYALFMPVKIEKWITKHSHFKAAYFDEEI